jgi:hypothetical protein
MPCQAQAAVVVLRRSTGPVLASRIGRVGGVVAHSGQRFGPAKILVQGTAGLRAVPVAEVAKAKSRPTRRLQRTPTAVSSYNGLRTESLRGALGACG